MAPPFLQCESHPGRLLTDHLLDVAGRLGEPGERLWMTGLFHDLGKATGFFQDYLHGIDGDTLLKAHSLFGALWLFETLSGDKATSEGILKAALHTLYIRGHHGRLDNLEDALTLDSAELDRCRQRLISADAESIARWLGERLNGGAIPIPGFQVKPLQRVRLGRALDGQTDPGVTWPRFQIALRDFGQLVAADRDSASGRPVDAPGPGTRLEASHLERFRMAGQFGSIMAQENISAARDAVYLAATRGASKRSGEGGHLWTLEVPTGAGKTLAALGWATARRRIRQEVGRTDHATIFYALPFTSIIDQTVAVLRRLWPEATAHPGSLAVHHHLAEYGAADGEGNSLARNWAEAWQADVVCTTFVQIVHALFHGTTADARRLAALADGGILILDEAQALPAELWPSLRTALRCLTRTFGVDVLLLTATQPALLNVEDDAVDLRPPDDARVSMAFDRYDVVIETGPAWDAAALVNAAAGLLDQALPKGARSALLLLNTVNEALAVYDEVQRHPVLGTLARFHLSTNLRPKDRLRIMGELRTLEATDSPRLLIATQVVEAGVDLSFDLVFRARAPLDAIVQAAGRCNRHGAGRRGVVIVFPFAGSTGHRVYGPIKMGVAGELLDEMATACVGQPIPEPTFVTRVPEFFRRVRDRLGSAANKAREVDKAVRRLEFAALRGEDDRDPTRTKQVELITEEAGKISVFVETDEEDEAIWQRLLRIHADTDAHRRRTALRALRGEVGSRVVAVPEHPSPPTPDPTTGLVYINRMTYPRFYDLDTGWKRALPN